MMSLVVWANVALALVLIAFMVRSRFSVSSTLLALIFFMTLHHGYAVLPLLFDKGLNYASSIHFNALLLPKLVGALFLSGVTFAVLWRYKATLSGLLRLVHLRVPIALTALFLISAVLIFTFGESTSLAAFDLLSMMGLLALSMAVGVLLLEGDEKKQPVIATLYFPIAVLSVLVAGVAFIEVISHSAWAVFPLRDGRLVYRASSTLFNPNMLGLWSVAIVLLGTYAWDGAYRSRWIAAILMLSGSVCIFLAGSRSSLLLSVAVLCGLILLRWKSGELLTSMKAALVFFGLFSLVLTAAAWSSSKASPDYPGVRSLEVLSERFILIPETLLHFVVGQRIPPPAAESPAAESPAAESDMVAIEGRLSGERVDNGYLAIKDDFGWFALLFWVLMLGYLLLQGLRKFYASPDKTGAYAVSLLVLLIMEAFVMRSFQVFPAWGGVALALGAFCFWLNTGEQAIIDRPTAL